MTLTNWDNITNYLESVGTSDKTFPFAKPQELVKVTNKGNANLIYTIGTQTGTLTPRQSITVNETISSITIRSASGLQGFEVWAVEKGTEKEEAGPLDLISISTQLADSATKMNSKAVAKGRNGVSPIISFISDDGAIEDYTLIKPIFTAQNVPFCPAVVTDWVNSTNKVTTTQLLELQNTYGWEIMSHTKSHQDLITLSDSQLDDQLKSSYEWLKNNGFKSNNLAYPYGNFNDKVKLATQKYYRSARSTNEQTVNTNPIASFEYKTVFITSDASISPITGFAKNSLNHYKWYIDNNYTNNGWLVISLHSWEIAQWGYQQLVTDILAYAMTKGRIVTVDQALDERENVVESSLFSKDKEYDSHFAVSPDGKVHSNLAFIKKLAVNAVTSDNLITDYELYSVSSCPINSSGASTFPEGSAGLLITYRLSPYYKDNHGYSYQEYHLYGSNKKYIRSVLDNGTWGAWYYPSDPANAFVVNLTADSVNNSTPPSGFTTNKVSYCRISSANATNFPNYSSAGTLITTKLSTDVGYIYQEYHCYNSLMVFKRIGGAGDTWGAWTKISAV